MAQDGRYEIRSSWWIVRYRETVVENGQVKRILRNQRLATVEEIKPKRGTEISTDGHVALKDVPKEITTEARKFLDRVNGQSGQEPEHNRRVGDFYTNVYLPHIAKTKAASTVKGYKDMWEDHISRAVVKIGQKQVPFSELWLRNVRTVHVTSVLQEIADEHGLSKNTLKHIKSFVSGIFTVAKQQGFLDGLNPVQDAALPHGAEAEEQYAYTLDEIENMLRVLPEPAATVIAAASFAGFSRSELRGLKWEEYENGEIRVERGVWESVVGKTKTRARRAVVPVIAQLRDRLENWRAKCGNPTEGWMFASEKNTPLNMNNVLNRQILPALRNAGLEWHGYHACRRALGTNLHRLGVPDVIIQRILRHSDVATTQKHYILVDTQDSKRELEKLEQVMVERKMASDRKPELLN